MGGRSGGSGFVGGILHTEFGDVDLTGMRLNYGEIDKTIPSKVRDGMVWFRDKYINNQREYGVTYYENGTIVEDVTVGDAHSVNTYYMPGVPHQTTGHIHPRVDRPNVLGGTFSETDLKSFLHDEYDTKYADAKEGRYIITKGKNYNHDGLMNYFRNAQKINSNKYGKELASIDHAYYSGEIDYATSEVMKDRAFNRYLVRQHNDLLAGRRKYGYSYTLERTPKDGN